MNKVLMSTKYK